MKSQKTIIHTLLSSTLALMLGIVLASCSHEQGTGNASISNIDIRGAKALLVEPNENKKQFKKITENNETKVIPIKSDDGKTLDIVPTRIYNASDDYIITPMTNGKVYLVNKDTGATYDMADKSSKSLFYISDKFQSLQIFADDNKNIYYNQYLSGEKGSVKAVIKLDVSNPSRITRQRYTPSLYNIENFVVDKFGNILFSYRDSVTHNIKQKIKSPKNGFLPVSFTSAFRGYDNRIYFYNSSNIKMKKTQQLLEDTSKNSISKTAGEKVNLHDNSLYVGAAHQFLYLKDRILVNALGPDRGQICEIYNIIQVTSPSCTSNNNLKNAKFVINSDDTYYIIGETSIKAVTPSKSQKIIDVITNSDYDFYEAKVSPDNVIYFTAFRNDGVHVFGKIDASTSPAGKPEILNTINKNNKEIILQRIK